MGAYVATVSLIFIFMVAYIVVDRVYRAFTRRHPEYGPGRKELGCGACGGCGHPNEDGPAPAASCSSDGGGNRPSRTLRATAVGAKIERHTKSAKKGESP